MQAVGSVRRHFHGLEDACPGNHGGCEHVTEMDSEENEEAGREADGRPARAWLRGRSRKISEEDIKKRH